MTTASQTMIAKVLGRRDENVALVLMAIGAAVLVASLGIRAITWPPAPSQGTVETDHG